MKYSLDTSALIEPWVRLYPPDLFEPVWDALEGLIEAGVVRASVEVKRELERQSDALYDWAAEGTDFSSRWMRHRRELSKALLMRSRT